MHKYYLKQQLQNQRINFLGRDPNVSFTDSWSDLRRPPSQSSASAILSGIPLIPILSVAHFPVIIPVVCFLPPISICLSQIFFSGHSSRKNKICLKNDQSCQIRFNKNTQSPLHVAKRSKIEDKFAKWKKFSRRKSQFFAPFSKSKTRKNHKNGDRNAIFAPRYFSKGITRGNKSHFA